MSKRRKLSGSTPDWVEEALRFKLPLPDFSFIIDGTDDDFRRLVLRVIHHQHYPDHPLLVPDEALAGLCLGGGYVMDQYTLNKMREQLEKVSYYAMTKPFSTYFRKSHVPGNKSARVQFLAQRFVYGPGRDILSLRVEDAASLDHIYDTMHADCRNMSMCGVHVPEEIVLEIFHYLPHDYQGACSVGCTCYAWYCCYVRTWDCVKLLPTLESVYSVPLVVLKAAYIFEIGFSPKKLPSAVKYFGLHARPRTLLVSGHSKSFGYALKRWGEALSGCTTLGCREKESPLIRLEDVPYLPSGLRCLDVVQRHDAFEAMLKRCPNLERLKCGSVSDPSRLPPSLTELTLCSLPEISRSPLTPLPPHVKTFNFLHYVSMYQDELHALLSGSSVRKLGLSMFLYTSRPFVSWFGPYPSVEQVSIVQPEHEVVDSHLRPFRSNCVFSTIHSVFPGLKRLFVVCNEHTTRRKLEVIVREVLVRTTIPVVSVWLAQKQKRLIVRLAREGGVLSCETTPFPATDEARVLFRKTLKQLSIIRKWIGDGFHTLRLLIPGPRSRREALTISEEVINGGIGAIRRSNRVKKHFVIEIGI